MKNEQMRILMERALHIPIAESDAALVLAGVEEQLRNKAEPIKEKVSILDILKQWLETSAGKLYLRTLPGVEVPLTHFAKFAETAQQSRQAGGAKCAACGADIVDPTPFCLGCGMDDPPRRCK